MLGVLVPLALTFVVFVALYRYLPTTARLARCAHRRRRRALGFQAVQIGLGWYLSGPADFTKVYGSASAIFAFLFSVYLSASAFVICAILTAVLDEALGRRSIVRRPLDGGSRARRTESPAHRLAGRTANIIAACRCRSAGQRWRPRARHRSPELHADERRLLDQGSSVRSIAVGLSPPTPEWYGLSRNQSRSSIEVIATATPPIIVPCTTTLSALSAKKSMKTKMIPADRSRTIQSGSRDHALGAVDAVGAGVLPVGALVEPLVERRLLGVGLRLDVCIVLNIDDAPGVDQLAEPARLHLAATPRSTTLRA